MERSLNSAQKLKEANYELLKKEERRESATITAGVFHNIGNILNSVKVSANVMGDIYFGNTISSFRKGTELLRRNKDNLKQFMAEDPKGITLLKYYLELDGILEHDIKSFGENIARLTKSIDIIDNTIRIQQSYSGVTIDEVADIIQITDDAIDISLPGLESQDIKIIQNYQSIPEISVKRIKLMHILMNLIKNAKEAMMEIPRGGRKIEISIFQEKTQINLQLSDFGCGIEKENLKNMFTHGFTTKEYGHGFGLHSCKRYMEEMGGDILVESEGPGKGTPFTLVLPIGT